MLRIKKLYFTLTLVLTIFQCTLKIANATAVSQTDWDNYKMRFMKTYPTSSGLTEATARFNLGYHMLLINQHNAKASNTYKLCPTQFSDMRIVEFSALFPVAAKYPEDHSSPLPPAPPPEISFNPYDGILPYPRIEDQGRACNSGWAHATAKAVEIFFGYMAQYPANSLSAKNIVDCAGRGIGCINQHSQAAFEFLTNYQQPLYDRIDYPNDITANQQGMCLPPRMPLTTPLALTKYGRINDDAQLQSYLPQYPVVIEFNPTSFEFMHYCSGVFQQPATKTGSHFMTVVGFGRDTTTNLDYWLVQNSFGMNWGENGFIRIVRKSTASLAKSALLPLE